MSERNQKTVYVWIVIFIIIIVALLLFIFNNKVFHQNENNNTNDSKNNVARLAQESNILGNNEKINEVNNRIENVLTNSQQTPKEEEIASYSTKLGGSTENRLTNIKITCKWNNCKQQ